MAKADGMFLYNGTYSSVAPCCRPITTLVKDLPSPADPDVVGNTPRP